MPVALLPRLAEVDPGSQAEPDSSLMERILRPRLRVCGPSNGDQSNIVEKSALLARSLGSTEAGAGMLPQNHLGGTFFRRRNPRRQISRPYPEHDLNESTGRFDKEPIRG